MKTTRLLGFAILTLLVMNICVYPLFAKAPTTPKILFTSAREGNRDVYIMNPDGSEQVNLTQHRATDQGAVWSLTGEQILFISDRGGVRDLYLMDADGSNARRVFKRKATVNRSGPSWASDGKQIAYDNLDWGGAEYGVHIAILGKQDVEHIATGSGPSWSPNGTEIACSISAPQSAQLTFINLRTRAREQPLPKKTLLWQHDPSWSAVGDRLAFSGNKHPIPVILDRELHNAWRDKQSIFIVNRDGTGLQQLVDEAGEEAWAPAISPDGAKVLYTQAINNQSQIFKVDVKSGVRTQLTHIGFPRFGNFGGDWFDPAYALPVAPQPHLLTTTWGAVKRQ